MKINHLDYREIFKENLLDKYSAICNEFDKRGWISTIETELKFEGDGQYYIPMLQSPIASKRIDQLRESRKSTLKSIEVIMD